MELIVRLTDESRNHWEIGFMHILFSETAVLRKLNFLHFAKP